MHGRLHRNRQEVAAFAAERPDLLQVTRRGHMDDDAWDKLVELQQDCQAAVRTCHDMWRELTAAALAEDDAAAWSAAAAPYSRFLKGEGLERQACLSCRVLFYGVGG